MRILIVFHCIFFLGLLATPSLALASPDDQGRFLTGYDVPENLNVEISQVGIPLEIVPEVEPGKAQIEVIGENANEALEIEFLGRTLKIQGKSDGARGELSIVSENGNVTILSGNSSPGNRVVVNGREITALGNTESKSLRCILRLPASVALTLRDGSLISAAQKLNSVTLQGAGAIQGEFSSSVHSADIQLSGSPRLHFKKLGSAALALRGAGRAVIEEYTGAGPFKAELSGSSRIEVRGRFPAVDVKLSGASRAEISGPVEGGFTASTSGASRVVHYGTVTGEIEQKTRGASSIKFYQEPAPTQE